MKTVGISKLAKLGAVGLSAMMLLAVLVLTPAPEASAQGTSPCPHFSIYDVFADPKGNWDGDQVNNADELYNGLNPCIADTGEHCAGGGVAICSYPTHGYRNYSIACQASITAYPNADYDGDGISNSVEILNGANPCAHPCPSPTGIDLALNPNGDWDRDGSSNAIEVNQGTNPCIAHAVRYIPYVPYIHYIPYVHHVHHVPHPPKVTPRLPHVGTVVKTPVYVAPVRPACPWNYPYYHAGNGLCYANPITPFW